MKKQLNPPPPNPLFAEWLDIMLDASPADLRLIARFLAAHDITPPTNWKPVVGTA